MGKRLIGLVGFIGSGKNTVSDILINEHGFTKESFADPLKDACTSIFGWERELLEGDTPESRQFREIVDDFWSDKLGYELTPRLALQKLGTEAGRDVFGENLWTTSLMNRVNIKILNDKVLRQETNIVISDVRFPNEINALQNMDAEIYRVRRGNEPVWYDKALSDNLLGSHLMEEFYPNVHISEWALVGYTDYDKWIDNDGSIDDLHESVKKNILKL